MVRRTSSLATDQRPQVTAIRPPGCKIGINGFGRIGRNVLRASLLRDDLEVVAINHTCATVDDVIHLILHDSTHGPLSRLGSHGFTVSALSNGNISVGGHEIVLTSERDLTKLDWSASGAEYVAECTGKFRTVETAIKHVQYGKARKVLISAPSSDAPTRVFKVNSDLYTSSETVVSNASCTSNCLAPIAKVLNDCFGIEQGFMSTIHASTNSQHVLDGYSKKSRRDGRSVIGNIIPTTTGAAKAISIVLPELTGKLTGISVRVPTANVSMVDLTVNTVNSTSLDQIMSAFRQAAETSLAGVLAVSEEELVSSDYLSCPFSAIIDVKASVELNSKFFKIVAWYDNEWGYSHRMLDVLAHMASVDLASTIPLQLTKSRDNVMAESYTTYRV